MLINFPLQVIIIYLFQILALPGQVQKLLLQQVVIMALKGILRPFYLLMKLNWSVSKLQVPDGLAAVMQKQRVFGNG
jgi:uncharacterized membrane protein